MSENTNFFTGKTKEWGLIFSLILLSIYLGQKVYEQNQAKHFEKVALEKIQVLKANNKEELKDLQAARDFYVKSRIYRGKLIHKDALVLRDYDSKIEELIGKNQRLSLSEIKLTCL